MRSAGMIFQWSDGWWKFGQDSRLDIHDTNASWPNAGYAEDYREGDNNMNEEWWGITAKGFPDAQRLLRRLSRAPPITPCGTRSGWTPTRPATDLQRSRITSTASSPWPRCSSARGDAASLKTSDARARCACRACAWSARPTAPAARTSRPRRRRRRRRPILRYRGFDHGQSFFADLEAQPSDAVIGRLVGERAGPRAAKSDRRDLLREPGPPLEVQAADGATRWS